MEVSTFVTLEHIGQLRCQSFDATGLPRFLLKSVFDLNSVQLRNAYNKLCDSASAKLNANTRQRVKCDRCRCQKEIFQRAIRTGVLGFAVYGL